MFFLRFWRNPLKNLPPEFPLKNTLNFVYSDHSLKSATQSSSIDPGFVRFSAKEAVWRQLVGGRLKWVMTVPLIETTLRFAGTQKHPGNERIEKTKCSQKSTYITLKNEEEYRVLRGFLFVSNLFISRVFGPALLIWGGGTTISNPILIQHFRHRFCYH